MSYLAKKEEKAMFPALSWSGACFGFPCPIFAGFFITFLGRFLYKEKTVEKFVNNQLAQANWTKKGRVAAMAHSNDFSTAWKLSDYQIKSK